MSSDIGSPPAGLMFCKLEPGEHRDALLQCIRDILAERDSHNLGTYDQDYWRWQYENLPSHQSAVYSCLENGRIGGYFHVALYDGLISGEKRLFGALQDLAVAKDLRGRGVFRELAEFATEDLRASGVDLLYVFPNDNSIRTFAKYGGFTTVDVFDTYLLPVRSSEIIRSRIQATGLATGLGAIADRLLHVSYPLSSSETVSVRSGFDDDVVGMFDRFASRFLVVRSRSRDYLTWRYLEKPQGAATVVSLTDATGIRAAAVFKQDRVFGADGLILLDFAFDEEEHLIRLVHHVKEQSRDIFDREIGFVLAAFCCRGLLEQKRYGFIKLPRRYNPRPLKMLVKNISSEEPVALIAENWFATLGDWDVF